MNWTPRTKAITGGRPPGDNAPANVPITPASHLGLEYAREDGTATWRALEEAIGELEDGMATAFASGMGAVAAVFDLLPAGAEVAVPTNSYVGMRGFLTHAQDAGRLRGRRIDPEDTATWVAAAGEVDLLWLESPTNPSLYRMDIVAIAQAAKAGANRPLVAVDNTFATPLGQQPLEMGADIVMHSATKLIGGHSDLLLGLTVTADETLAERLREARTLSGATPGALEAWLVLRGLRTLPVRYAEVCRSANLLAERLEAHAAVGPVRSAGGMIAFELSGADTADAFCGKLRLIRHATSLGGVESTVERRAALPGDSHVPAGLIRFSVGLEDPEDLWGDLTQALS